MAKERPATKICKHCATEIPYEAKVCPNCRKKVKGGKLKWIIIGLIVLGIIGSLMGGNDDDSKKADSVPVQEEVKEDVQEDVQEEVTEAAQEEVTAAPQEEVTEAKIEYKKYNVTELFDDINANALKAEKTHQDEYVEITGHLGTIDSDGKYIGLGAAEDDYDYIFQEVQCFIKTDEQLNQVMELTKGDEITVRGKIKSIGEVLGYSLDIEEIK